MRLTTIRALHEKSFILKITIWKLETHGTHSLMRLPLAKEAEIKSPDVYIGWGCRVIYYVRAPITWTMANILETPNSKIISSRGDVNWH